MKVTAILTVVSLCLAGLVKAAPVDEQQRSGIVISNKNGEKEIDFEYFLSTIDAIESNETEDDSEIEKQMKIFVNLIMEEVQEQKLMEKFLHDLVNASNLQDSFEKSDGSNKIFPVSEALSPSKKSQSEGVLERRRFKYRSCEEVWRRKNLSPEEYEREVEACRRRLKEGTGVLVEPIKRAARAVFNWLKESF